MERAWVSGNSMLRSCYILSAIECFPPHDDGDECRYRIAWTINPHMRVGAGNFRRAAAQHAALRRALHALGVDIVELPFVHGAYDSVFAKDPALLVERRGERLALLASQRHAERRSEQRARARTFARLGFEVVPPPTAIWEGGDVVMLPRVPPSGEGGALLGYGPRSERAAAAWLEQRLEAPVFPLELRDAYFFHLDTALAVLPDGTALVCEEALSRASLRQLERIPSIRDIVSVPRREAMAFGLNLLVVGPAVILGGRAPTVERVVASRGLAPVIVPLDEFQLAGGSVACLVTRVHRDEQEAFAQPARWAVA